jgi:hypothetical protein
MRISLNCLIAACVFLCFSTRWSRGEENGHASEANAAMHAEVARVNVSEGILEFDESEDTRSRVCGAKCCVTGMSTGAGRRRLRERTTDGAEVGAGEAEAAAACRCRFPC